MSNNVPVQTRLLKVIQEEIENALDAYPNKFCQIFFYLYQPTPGLTMLRFV